MQALSSLLVEHPLVLPLLLIAIVAPLGAIDIAYYHVWRFRLHDQPASRAETVTHLVRGALFASVSAVLTGYEPHGTWFWLIGGLLVLDFANSIADVALEPASRAPLGGLPPLEYVIHIVGSTFGGAVTLAYFALGWRLGEGPPALVPIAGALPAWLLIDGALLAIGGAAMTLGEGFLFARSILRRRGTGRAPALDAAVG